MQKFKIDMHLQKLDKLLEVHIFMTKKKRKYKKYSPELKISVIMDMREHHLGYCETARKYNLGDPNLGGVVHMLRRWERIFLEEGAEGLMKERRGKASGSKKGRLSKLDKKTEKVLVRIQTLCYNGYARTPPWI